MVEEVKFTDEEMKQLVELQQRYQSIQNALGQLGVARLRLEQQVVAFDTEENNIKSQFTEIQNQERGFVDSVNKKYGDGNLDISTGVFTPRSVEETPDKTL
tara:strand:- start:922 stop:1224 length:303 start_codon:yes stop_codon:yes gene_type:complete